MQKCFNTDKRIRLGIWGLGRGTSFIKAAKAVNIDIVAGCDYSQSLRDSFREQCPDAFITTDENEFLSFRDMDAVLIATYFEKHAEHTVKALEAGYPVIAHMGAGTFTKSGHYILLRGLTEDGRVLVNDPNSEKRSYQAYDISLIVKEAKTDYPFMVCRKMK